MLTESIQRCHRLSENGEPVHASPLQLENPGMVVRVHDGKDLVTDGPFMETTQQFAGYFLV